VNRPDVRGAALATTAFAGVVHLVCAASNRSSRAGRCTRPPIGRRHPGRRLVEALAYAALGSALCARLDNAVAARTEPRGTRGTGSHRRYPMSVWRLGAALVPRRSTALAGRGLLQLAGLLLAVCGPAPTRTRAPVPPGNATAAAPGAAALTNEGGQVRVTVTWGGPAAGPVFGLALNTHAVDLEGYDLAKLAVPRVDSREIPAMCWDAPKGGHHRQGSLVFPTNGADGQPTIGAGATAVEVVVRGVAGVPERTFRSPL
jgi:hypothetical protein